ncbi:MAG: endo-1,4-beta-xylanase [Patescibacteria group bacterium]|jgi:hypothetical protein
MKKSLLLSIPVFVAFLLVITWFGLRWNGEVFDFRTPHLHDQIGLNFIRYNFTDALVSADELRPEAILGIFSELGIGFQRQLVLTDLTWGRIEPSDDEWNFASADSVIMKTEVEPIVDLFIYQYASPNPPWLTKNCTFEKTIGPEAEEYIRTVVTRYADYVTYWDIGNEMNHWRALDELGTAPDTGKFPACLSENGFSPQEQGIFLAQAAELIRQYDPDAVILLSGIGGLDDYAVKNWIGGVVESSGTDWFDVVTYHYYGNWQSLIRQREDFTSELKQMGLGDKPVWLTETGSTASQTLTVRTNYPNSEESQAADIFRRIIGAYGAGDEKVIWHTFISSPDAQNNDWRMYGIMENDLTPNLSYYSFKLLIDELLPFEKVTKQNLSESQYIYKVTREDGEVRYVAWGSGSWEPAKGLSSCTSVVPDNDGDYSWEELDDDQPVLLSETPILLK